MASEGRSWADEDPDEQPDFTKRPSIPGLDETPGPSLRPKSKPSSPDAKKALTPDEELAQELAEKVKVVPVGESQQQPRPESPAGEHHISLKDKNVGQIDWDAEVEVQRQDPNSPIYSKCQNFEELGLEPNLLKGVYAMGFNRPSKIQETTLPMIVQKPPRDLLAQSQSGTGKTAAFSLGMLSRVETDKKYPQVICLSPTRELARQTHDVCSKMGQYMDIKILIGVQGERFDRNHKITEQIIIGTPGTIMTWLKFRFFDPRKVVMLVFDEADQMLDVGMRHDSLRIKQALGQHQTLLFSATYADDVRQFAEQVLRGANMVTLKKKELTLDGIKQFWVDCKNSDQRYEVLLDIYSSIAVGQAIIFCDRVETAHNLAKRMTAEGHQVGVLFGGNRAGLHMESSERDKIMDNFRDGKVRVLISTDVLARGIDISQVNVVINYDIPIKYETRKPDTETYLHRIGRTGRFGRRGLGINFCYDEKSRQDIQYIEKFFDRPITRITTDDPEQFEKMLVL
eukprot:comp27371_c0_seq1/m.47152 comp27371_c0_seq1/g.47152  ORF comp27371_c0_seq1/g.47152 comp27371_c0_seq1/m.47152 type:complete len:512 (-) comp27371_c0_seq1:388-1923(-)